MWAGWAHPLGLVDSSLRQGGMAGRGQMGPCKGEGPEPRLLLPALIEHIAAWAKSGFSEGRRWNVCWQVALSAPG